MSEFVTLRVGPKNRVVIPARLREEAGVTVGSELVAHVDSMGRLVLETAASARSRVWAAAPLGEGDSMAELRAARALDREIEEASAVRRGQAPRDSSAGDRLLAELGL